MLGKEDRGFAKWSAIVPWPALPFTLTRCGKSCWSARRASLSTEKHKTVLMLFFFHEEKRNGRSILVFIETRHGMLSLSIMGGMCKHIVYTYNGWMDG